MASICIFGDSITYGYWDAQGGWAQRIKRMEKSSKVHVLGMPGETSTELLMRLKDEAKALKADHIIIAIGINDSQKSQGNNLVPKKEFEENIEKLIKESKKICQKVTLIGLTRVDEAKTSEGECAGYYNESIQEYDKTIKEKAAEQGAEYVPIFDLLTNNDLEDGLHPNTQGHEKMAKMIMEASKNI